jgi:hypothetical protein
LRQALIRAAARTAFEAWNRGDFDLVPYIDDPGVETRLTQAARGVVGLDAVYYGPEGHCRSMQAWNEAWDSWDADIQEVIDEAPNRIVVVARIKFEGHSSGIQMNEWGAVKYTFRDGRILRVDGALERDRDRVLGALETMAQSN